MRFWKTLPFPIFLKFLLPILFWMHFFCNFVLHKVICKPLMKENTMFKPKFCQKPGKTAILAASRRDIGISENPNY